MLKKDLKNKAGLNFVLCLFILIATILMSTGVVLMAGAFTNEERTYEMTKSPDMFCTLPTPMDESVYETIEERIKKIGNYEYFDRYEAYRLEGTSVRFGDGTSEFSTNEGRRDFLLQNMPEENNRPIDYDNEFFEVENGQIAISQTFERKQNIKIGDKIRITTQLGNIYEFTVAKFFKLPSAELIERLIISDDDFETLNSEFPVKTTVYNIYCPPEGDYITELSREGNLFANDLTHYELEVNPGRALFVTNDGILTVIVSIVFEISAAFTLAMIFVTINFSLHSEIKREERELGMMKAIGVDSLSYKTLFIVKYIFFAIVGGIAAIPATVVLSTAVMNKIYYHLVLPSEGFVILLSVLTGILLLLIIIGFSFLSLRRINKISIMTAIHGDNRGERFKKVGLFLHGRKKLPIPVFLAVGDILRGIKRYAGLIISFILGIVVLILVVQARDTILTDNYLHRYFQMGHINFFCRFDDAYMNKLVQQGGSYEGALEIVNDNFKENGIPAYIEIFGQEHATIQKDGTDIASFLKWHESSNNDVLIVPGGNAPILRNEVAITAFHAKREGIKIGDTITIKFEKYSKDHVTLEEVCEDFIVTGFIDSYGSGATNILIGDEYEKEYLSNEVLDFYEYRLDCKSSEYDETFKKMDDLYKDNEIIFYDLDHTADQMLPGFKDIFDMMLVIVSILVFVVLALLTFLYERMFIEEEQTDIAMMKCIGFKTSNCRAWHLIRLVILSAAAVIVGHIFIVAVGTPIFAEIFKSAMRTTTFKLNVIYMHNFVIIPVAVMAALTLLIYISTHGMNLIKIWRIRNE